MNELKPEDVMRAKDSCDYCLHYDVCKIWVKGLGVEKMFPHEVESAPCEQFQPKDILREKDADIKRRDAKIDTLQKQVRQYGAEIGKKDAEIADYIRQIAEMQREIACQADLITFLEKYKKAEADKDAEIERLNKALDTMVIEHKRLVEIARTDAITKFAKRVKKEVQYIPWCEYKPVHNCIDQIAEEMKGD